MCVSCWGVAAIPTATDICRHTATSDAERSVVTFWTDAGRRWTGDADRVELIGGGVGRLVMDRVDLRPGMRVLDVGCGSGTTTVELAERTSPGGVAVGVDLSPTMLVAARERAVTGSVEFVQDDAQHMALTAGSFDRVFSRFGVMFFEDPRAALANLRRALRADGLLGFASWQGPDHNEWMQLPASAAAAVLDAPVELPPMDRPGPFALAESTRIMTLLEDAGFRGIEVAPHNDHVSLPLSDVMAFAGGSMTHGGIRAALGAAGSDVERRVQHAIAERLAARTRDDVIHLRRGANIVLARP